MKSYLFFLNIILLNFSDLEKIESFSDFNFKKKGDFFEKGEGKIDYYFNKNMCPKCFPSFIKIIQKRFLMKLTFVKI